jgi:glutamyl endopeptidase
MFTKIGQGLGVAGVTLALGCSGAVETRSDSRLDRHVSAPVEVEQSQAGLRYVRLRKNQPDQYDAERARELAERPARQSTAAPRELATMSERELTERMTGITLVDGWIYRVEPEPSTVRAARQRAATRIRAQRPSDPLVGPLGALAAPLILWPDERQPQRGNTEYPYSTIVHLEQLGLPDGYVAGGTGVMIGRSTLLTAAHVFWDGQNFREFDAWPGVDIEDADPKPFGSFECYGVIIAADSGWPADDYAVVDFKSPSYDCNDAPGDSTGWMGLNPLDDAALSGATAYLYGYPVDNDHPYPQLWGMAGTLLPPYPDVLRWDMDQSPGQSGSPIYVLDGAGYPDIVGVTSTGIGDFGFYENRGPRVTAELLANIDAWSTEY